MSIDLHIHSVNSDGTFSVEEIVNLSKELQLEAISITDHEYLTEVPSDNDIKIIKGIEVGADWKELKSKNPFAGIHLLVYFLDRNTSLNTRLEEIRNKKKERNYIILESLKKSGIDIEKSELDLINTKVPGRPHIAQIMVEKQYVSNVSEAFTKFLRNGIIPNIDTHQLDIEEIIQLSKESKSLIFLAHPHTLMSSESYKKNQNWITSEFFDYLKQIKIMGLSFKAFVSFLLAVPYAMPARAPDIAYSPYGLSFPMLVHIFNRMFVSSFFSLFFHSSSKAIIIKVL